MKIEELRKTASALMDGNKGLIAMDESIASCNKRFRDIGIPETIEYRRAWRELIVTAPGIGNYLSGAILFDESIYQTTDDGMLFPDILRQTGVIPGIKVDQGTVELAGFPTEAITLGLDTLRERLSTYAAVGMKFAKWRAVIRIKNELPNDGCIEANMHELSRYAALCQEAGILPIVEPEVLMDGVHDIAKCFTVTLKVLNELFTELIRQRVDLSCIILKPNMVMPGNSSGQETLIDTVSLNTVLCLLRSVPAQVPGIAFLSGGQPAQLATAHLNAMNIKYKSILPWPLTYSYSRAIQQPALEYWKGSKDNVHGAQQLLLNRIKLNSLAREGRYNPAMENDLHIMP